MRGRQPVSACVCVCVRFSLITWFWTTSQDHKGVHIPHKACLSDFICSRGSRGGSTASEVRVVTLSEVVEPALTPAIRAALCPQLALKYRACDVLLLSRFPIIPSVTLCPKSLVPMTDVIAGEIVTNIQIARTWVHLMGTIFSAYVHHTEGTCQPTQRGG